MAQHPADLHDVIRVRGARENNLRDINVDIPKRRLTVFTGVSGSGKSSLVFDTIAAESRRLIDETYTAFEQGFMPHIPRPDVDALAGLTPAIIVDQERLGANVRSTVGTVTDANAMLRTLFSRCAQPHIGGPTAYSFNVPTQTASGIMTSAKGEKKIVREAVYVGGMCPTCEGRGEVSSVNIDRVIDRSLSLHEGAILVPGYTADGWAVRLYAESGLYPADKPISSFTKKQLDEFLYGKPRKIKIQAVNLTYEGLIPKITKSMFSKDHDSLQPHIRRFVEQSATFGACPDCEGTRLTEAARSATIDGVSIADVSRMQVVDAAQWLQSLSLDGVAPLLGALQATLDSFVSLGLGYLSLDRPSGSLSGGEAQRIKLLRHVGSALTDITYVFDEPTIGLHPHDIERMNNLLLELRDKGNTVLVIEHKPKVVAIADHIVDIGPGGGANGGEVTFTGSLEKLRASDTITGRHLSDRGSVKGSVRVGEGVISVIDATLNNLRNVSVDVPRGVLTVVTGVAGSGKSSLIHGYVAHEPDTVAIDQSTIRGSRRSSPATYTGVLDPIRKAFAKANGVKPSMFSSNSEGACPSCKGAGVITTELGFMETVETPCEDCGGRRFQPAVFDYELNGKNIADVLDMSIAQAKDFFGNKDSHIPAVVKSLRGLDDVGLGYVSLGQPLSSLSGGERQRIRLAQALTENSSVVILDEPTNGLHLADIDNLLRLLDAIVDDGRTVIVIEHHLAVIAHADWVIDMGPGAGHDGGNIVFQGTPQQLAADGSTLTGQYLAQYLAQ
ncbi:ATP-binding cassette domain-containing protein [Microbacterium sp. YY-01]|uniref:ATP-binding cassette domain-containing protein n=1 Tax=Microbacterium sp. YY-01 TaxID=3421634 RepID=UPI003D184678